MSERTGHVLRIERTFDAPAEDVFDAWTNEEVMRRWLHGRHDLETPIAEVDLRVGGRIRIVMRNPDDGTEYAASGEYRVIERPSRLTFTWTWTWDDENPQLIDLEFTEQGGKTTVVMINSGIGAEQQRDQQESGWQTCYDNLERELAA